MHGAGRPKSHAFHHSDPFLVLCFRSLIFCFNFLFQFNQLRLTCALSPRLRGCGSCSRRYHARKATCGRAAAHRRCVRRLHPLLKNLYSLHLASTLAFTTHPPRCCEDHARLVADKLASQWQRAKRSPAGVRHRDILAASWWVSGEGQCRDETPLTS